MRTLEATPLSTLLNCRCRRPKLHVPQQSLTIANVYIVPFSAPLCATPLPFLWLCCRTAQFSSRTAWTLARRAQARRPAHRPVDGHTLTGAGTVAPRSSRRVADVRRRGRRGRMGEKGKGDEEGSGAAWRPCVQRHGTTDWAATAARWQGRLCLVATGGHLLSRDRGRLSAWAPNPTCVAVYLRGQATRQPCRRSRPYLWATGRWGRHRC